MSQQFYQPDPHDLVACDDGLHFILLDEANDHCNWVMRLHPDGGLVSVRKATEHELAHAKVRQHLRAGVADLEGSKLSRLTPTFDEAAERAAAKSAWWKLPFGSMNLEYFTAGWLACARLKAGVAE